MSTLNKILDGFLKMRILNHASFWILMVLLLAYHGSLFGGNFHDNLINMLAFLPVQMAAAYLLTYFQIPKFLYPRHWFRFIFSFVIIAYLLSVLARLSVIYIAEPLLGLGEYHESFLEILQDPTYLIKVYTVSLYLPAFLLFMIKMTKERFAQETRLVSLEKEKNVAELNFLKAQMNPHFLFNTLNTIYALAKKNAEQTSDTILKFSEILAYTIYECNDEKVPIIKEWQLIENYVDLQSIRHNDQLTIVIEQQIDDEAKEIAPLILISLVENAFKHSLRSIQDRPSIKISLKVEQNVLSFSIFNTKPNKPPTKKSNQKGIGVNNVKQQLNLLYPNRHTIHIDNQADFFKVNLSIQL